LARLHLFGRRLDVKREGIGFKRIWMLQSLEECFPGQKSQNEENHKNHDADKKQYFSYSGSRGRNTCKSKGTSNQRNDKEEQRPFEHINALAGKFN
jgi:hypothetical protein